MDKIIISVLDDNRDMNGLLTERNAFSLLIEYNNKKILLDSGTDDTLIKNAKQLDKPLDNVDYAVLSHGHYDHGDGLKYLTDKKIIVGKGAFKQRFSKRRNGVSSALSYGKEIKMQNKILSVSKRKKLFENIYIFKTNYRPFEFENNNYPTYLKNGKDDIVKDEISIAIKTENGLVVLSGCSHAGICNIVRNAQKIFNEQKVYAVVGGFHLTNKIERAKLVINKLKELGVQKCFTGHCISPECVNEICNIFPDTVILHTNLIINL